MPIYDHFGQTENGMLVNNYHSVRHEVMPGRRMVAVGDDDRALSAEDPGTQAVDLAQSPLMWFRDYSGQGDKALAGGYYRTGDTVERAANGLISFFGRSDDVITSSGYRTTPSMWKTRYWNIPP